MIAIYDSYVKERAALARVRNGCPRLWRIDRAFELFAGSETR